MDRMYLTAFLPFNFELTAPSYTPWKRNKSCKRLLRVSSGKLVFVSVGSLEKPRIRVLVKCKTKLEDKRLGGNKI